MPQRCSGLVILVDAFPDEREMYTEFLRHSGFDVSVYDDAAAAVAVARECAAAAIVTRILQPGNAFDGIELTRRIKADERTKHIPVVIITTAVQAQFRSAAERAGCDTFLVLPCAPDVLASEVLRLTTRSQAPAVTEERHENPDSPE